MEENELLRREIEDLKHLNKELMMDSEDNDARIIKSYRAKIVQLERQVQLLTKCNNIKAEAVTDIDNFVNEIVGEEEDSSPLERSHLRKWGKMLQEKIRNYNILTKQAENQKYFMECKYSSGTDTIQNVCNYSRNDDIPYLEVTTVLELENDLTHVYRNLYRMRSHLNANKKEIKDSNFLLLSDITINNITKVLNEMVELSLVLPKKDKSTTEEISSSYKLYYNPMNMSTAEIMSKLPRIGNSKTSKDVEDSVRQLVKAFHSQKTLFEIDLQVKQEELNIMTKTSTFYNSYFSELLKEIDQKYKEYTNQIGPVSPSSSSLSKHEMLEEIIQGFEEFDRESTEGNLRNFLMIFKDNIYLLDDDQKEPTKKKNRPNINIKTYYERFKAHVEEVQSEFMIRKNEFIEKMYNLNPEVEKYENIEPFISYTPYDNSSSISKKQTARKKPPMVNSSVNNLRTSSAVRGSTMIRKDSIVRKPIIQSQAFDATPSPELKEVTPKVGVSSNSNFSSNSSSSSNSSNSSRLSLNANVKEISQRVEDQRKKIEDMSDSLINGSLSDMKQYALRKQIVSRTP